MTDVSFLHLTTVPQNEHIVCLFAFSVCKAGLLLRPACDSCAITKLISGNPKLCYKNYATYKNSDVMSLLSTSVPL